MNKTVRKYKKIVMLKALNLNFSKGQHSFYVRRQKNFLTQTVEDINVLYIYTLYTVYSYYNIMYIARDFLTPKKIWKSHLGIFCFKFSIFYTDFHLNFVNHVKTLKNQTTLFLMYK
jgi:hypothetical protein